MNDAVDLRDAVAPVAECDWPTTNCYIDAWMQILASWGLDPLAGLGVTVAQDYEGDQFTFFKYLHEDLETLYGVVVGELSIWHSLEVQLAAQVRMGRLVLVEVDGYYLPDTRATSYRTQHIKTTIGIDAMDLAAGRLTYFHNVGHYELSGEDYAGVFRRLPGQDAADDVLPPYVEFVRRRRHPLRGSSLTDAAVRLLRRHLRRRPEENPIRCYRADFQQQMNWLMAHPDRFHDYAFGLFRQLGANFQLLAAHVDWLRRSGVSGLEDAREAALAISASAKAMQFKAARIASRRRFDPCDALFDALETNYETAMGSLDRAMDQGR
ncbi:MAG TPA: DUF1839 family protein [Acetobacteraceae bacterium]|nr:DUF1839 family protein [Acetobacteraceae bacterium]